MVSAPKPLTPPRKLRYCCRAEFALTSVVSVETCGGIMEKAFLGPSNWLGTTHSEKFPTPRTPVFGELAMTYSYEELNDTPLTIVKYLTRSGLEHGI